IRKVEDAPGENDGDVADHCGCTRCGKAGVEDVDPPVDVRDGRVQTLDLHQSIGEIPAAGKMIGRWRVRPDSIRPRVQVEVAYGPAEDVRGRRVDEVVADRADRNRLDLDVMQRVAVHVIDRAGDAKGLRTGILQNPGGLVVR